MSGTRLAGFDEHPEDAARGAVAGGTRPSGDLSGALPGGLSGGVLSEDEVVAMLDAHAQANGDLGGAAAWSDDDDDNGDGDGDGFDEDSADDWADDWADDVSRCVRWLRQQVAAGSLVGVKMRLRDRELEGPGVAGRGQRNGEGGSAGEDRTPAWARRALVVDPLAQVVSVELVKERVRPGGQAAVARGVWQGRDVAVRVEPHSPAGMAGDLRRRVRMAISEHIGENPHLETGQVRLLATFMAQQTLTGSEDGARLVVDLMPWGRPLAEAFEVMHAHPGRGLEAAGLPLSLAGRVAMLLPALRSTAEIVSQLGVLHRDIDPGNIILVDGTARLSDWGVPRALRREASHTWTAVLAGKPSSAYFAPELREAVEEAEAAIAAGLPVRNAGPDGAVFRYTAAVDAWAFGCVLAELLTGAELLQVSPRRWTPPPLVQGLPAVLRDTVTGLMNPDPAARLRLENACAALEGWLVTQDVTVDGGAEPDAGPTGYIPVADVLVEAPAVVGDSAAAFAAGAAGSADVDVDSTSHDEDRDKGEAQGAAGEGVADGERVEDVHLGETGAPVTDVARDTDTVLAEAVDGGEDADSAERDDAAGADSVDTAENSKDTGNTENSAGHVNGHEMSTRHEEAGAPEESLGQLLDRFAPKVDEETERRWREEREQRLQRRSEMRAASGVAAAASQAGEASDGQLLEDAGSQTRPGWRRRVRAAALVGVAASVGLVLAGAGTVVLAESQGQVTYAQMSDATRKFARSARDGVQGWADALAGDSADDSSDDTQAGVDSGSGDGETGTEEQTSSSEARSGKRVGSTPWVRRADQYVGWWMHGLFGKESAVSAAKVEGIVASSQVALWARQFARGRQPRYFVTGSGSTSSLDLSPGVSPGTVMASVRLESLPGSTRDAVYRTGCTSLAPPAEVQLGSISLSPGAYLLYSSPWVGPSVLRGDAAERGRLVGLSSAPRSDGQRTVLTVLRPVSCRAVNVAWTGRLKESRSRVAEQPRFTFQLPGVGVGQRLAGGGGSRVRYPSVVAGVVLVPASGPLVFAKTPPQFASSSADGAAPS